MSITSITPDVASSTSSGTSTVSTNSSGDAITGTSGTTLDSGTTSELSQTAFLQMMMAELQYQDPMDPSSQDPTQFLTELAQMTQVEQETDTAQSTSQSASEQAVYGAVGLIGDTVTYRDTTTGELVTGQVQSVQITSSGPTLTVGGVADVAPASITNVVPSSSSAQSGDSSGSTATKTTASDRGAASTTTAVTGGTSAV